MTRLVRSPHLRVLLALLLALSLGASACSGPGTSGAPAAPGQYEVQKNSVHYDGERYELYWADKDGSLHRMETRNLRMVRDDARTFLEVPSGGDPVLHLREDEPVTVQGRDREGGFTSSWFPFLLGTALGSGFGRGRDTVVINQPAPGERGPYDPRSPAYRYPPTDSFGRGEELHGSVDTSRPAPPDYRKVQPAPYATSGQSAGTGGGTAATNKAPGRPGEAGGAASNAASGQSGGTGGGTAASSKGGFAHGDQGYQSKAGGSAGAGAGSHGVLNGGESSGTLKGKPSGGSSPGKGIGGAGKGIGGGRAGGGRR